MYSLTIQSFSTAIILFVIACLLSLLFRIMIMLAVGFDSKAICVKNRQQWMALAFFVPVSAIVYVCIKKNLKKTVPQHCYSCGATVQPDEITCNQCGSARLSDYVVAGSEKKKKSALICLIIGLVAYFAGIVFICFGSFSVFQTLVKDYYDNSSSYYDFDDNYGYYDDNYDDFFEFYGDDNYDDYLDGYSDYFYQMP